MSSMILPSTVRLWKAKPAEKTVNRPVHPV